MNIYRMQKYNSLCLYGLISWLFIANAVSQNIVDHTRDYFPPQIHKRGNAFFQKVKVVQPDSVFYNYYEYYYGDTAQKKLISKTYDSYGQLRMEVQEDITDAGTVITGGFLYKDGKNGEIKTLKVRTKKAITFPFMPLSDLKGWQSHTKATYDHKIVSTSHIRFTETKSFEFSGILEKVLFFRRSKTLVFSGNYESESYDSEIIFTFRKHSGLSDFYYGSEIQGRNYATVLENREALPTLGSVLNIATIFRQQD